MLAYNSNVYKKIKAKIIILYFLNISDIFFTLLLVKSNMCVEVNPFMKTLITTPLAAVLIKAVIPLFLLYYIYRRLLKASNAQRIWADRILFIACSVYLLINIVHISSVLLMISLS